jgi:hypothetical protein
VLPVVDGEQQTLTEILQTDTVAQRNVTAQQCLTALKLSLPAVVDKDDNKVNQAYAGWPDRMVVIGVDGKIAYYGKPGPGGFRPNEVDDWLKENVASKEAK